MNVIPETRPAH